MDLATREVLKSPSRVIIELNWNGPRSEVSVWLNTSNFGDELEKTIGWKATSGRV